MVSFSFAHLVQRLDSSTYVDRNKDAVVFNDERVTYQQLRDRSARLASALAGIGVKHGDRVAILLRNDTVWFDAFFAVAALGAVFVPVNFLLKPAEIAFQLKDSGAKVLLCGADLRANGENAVNESPDCTRLIVVGDDYAAFRDAAPAVFPRGRHPADRSRAPPVHQRHHRLCPRARRTPSRRSCGATSPS